MQEPTPLSEEFLADVAAQIEPFRPEHRRNFIVNEQTGEALICVNHTEMPSHVGVTHPCVTVELKVLSSICFLFT